MRLNDRTQSDANNSPVIEVVKQQTTIKELVARAIPEQAKIPTKPEERAGQKKSHKKKQPDEGGQTRAAKKLRKFTVTKDDGTPLGEHEATSAHLAAMKAQPEGTRDNPVKVTVQEAGSDKTTGYVAYRDESNHMIIKKPR
jgi:hypothetical protein